MTSEIEIQMQENGLPNTFVPRSQFDVYVERSDACLST